MKYLFLIVAAAIAIPSGQAYMNTGAQFMGSAGRIAALAVFLLVQWFELRPIVLTNGAASAFDMLGTILAGKAANLKGLADPEELMDASMWAYRAYAVDLVAGLLVWPVIQAAPGLPAWTLLKVGGVTFANVSWGNAGRIVACVFLLQWCVQQYLRMGGRFPSFIGGRKNASNA